MNLIVCMTTYVIIHLWRKRIKTAKHCVISKRPWFLGLAFIIYELNVLSKSGKIIILIIVNIIILWPLIHQIYRFNNICIPIKLTIYANFYSKMNWYFASEKGRTENCMATKIICHIESFLLILFFVFLITFLIIQKLIAIFLTAKEKSVLKVCYN